MSRKADLTSRSYEIVERTTDHLPVKSESVQIAGLEFKHWSDEKVNLRPTELR